MQDVNKGSHSDLFIASKGGSNKFGIVFRIDLEAFPGAKVRGRVYFVFAGYIPAFLEVSNATSKVCCKRPQAHKITESNRQLLN